MAFGAGVSGGYPSLNETDRGEGTKLDIQYKTEDIVEYRDISPQTRKEGLLGLWSLFIDTLARVLDRLHNNDAVLRLFWQPGDIKISLRPHDSRMPGFVPWVTGTKLSKETYPSLYEAIGRGDVDDETLFTLPDIDRNYLQAATSLDKIGSEEGGGSTTTSGHRGVLVTFWVKT